MSVGEKIKNKRNEKNYTQEDLANLLHVSRSTISSWEVGRTYPDLDTVVKISDLLGITLDELLKEDKVMTRSISNKIRNNKYYKVTIIVLLVALVASIIGMYMYNRSLDPYREWYQDHVTSESRSSNRIEPRG
ncbi:MULTISPECIES: helix-turn-helix transcriptional regulator [Enterococcus]|uniref:helix-turn-helix transcriptional regulator n=1 Tax=Enterococcus TaxID=1350 RepID=UPI0008E17876|nr:MULTISPECIES: helix-turn-helix domain-containing protein [Enterococcus]SFE61830.1 DNA-binding transcriptional regulator, XRE-family HTH domain [Enterococcus casseliflavus]